MSANDDGIIPHAYWVTTTVTEYPRTGMVARDSQRVRRSVKPPGPTKPEGDAVQKFHGEPTRIEVFEAEASTSWDVESGIQDQPRELAENLLSRGRARLATGEPVTRRR
jgi:hypothetical protein